MKRENVVAGLIFFIITLLFFFPVFKGLIPFPGDLLVGNFSPYSAQSYEGYGFGAVPHMAQGHDVIRQLYPWKYFAVESFKNFQIPLWNPYNFSGYPLMANFQSGVFYPLNLIFFVLDFNTAWTIYILLTPVLSAIFTYLYLRSLKIDKISSIFSGFVFAFSSYMVVWMEYGNVGHTLLWLPLTLLLIDKILVKKNIAYSVIFISVLFLSFLAGYIQGYFYLNIVAFAYFLWRSRQLNKFSVKNLLYGIVLFIVPLMLASFQLLPTLEIFSFSSRSDYSLAQIEKLLNPAWYLVTIFVPNFFGHPASRNFWFDGTYIERVSYFGLIPLFFALLALFNFKKNIYALFFGAIFFLSLILTTDLFITKYFYLIPIPVVSTTVPTRLLSLFVFAGSILSAFGMQTFLKREHGKNVLKLLIILFLLFILGWAFVFSANKITDNALILSNLNIIKRNLFIPTGLFALIFLVAIVWYRRVKLFNRKLIIAVIFLLTFSDLFYFFHKITPFSQKNYIYPSTEVFKFIKENAGINRFWGYGSGSIDNNFASYEKIYATGGYDPLQIKSYGELLSSAKKGSLEKNIPRSDAEVPPGYGEHDLRDNYFRQRAMNLLGIKYVLHRKDVVGNELTPDYATFDEKKYKLVWQKNGWQVYENLESLPRIFLASDYIVEKNKEKMISTVFNPKFDLREKIILEESIPSSFNLGKSNGSEIKVNSFTPNNISLNIKTDTDSLLFLSDNYYPGWNASIDNKNVKIYRADYSFRAVPLPKGSHVIEFWYSPRSFSLGLIVSVLTLLGIGVIIGIKKRKQTYV